MYEPKIPMPPITPMSDRTFSNSNEVTPSRSTLIEQLVVQQALRNMIHVTHVKLAPRIRIQEPCQTFDLRKRIAQNTIDTGTARHGVPNAPVGFWL